MPGKNAREARRVRRTKKAELDAKIAAKADEILKQVVLLSCNVCERHFGYAEIDGCASALGPAGYCSRECIRKTAEGAVEMEGG